MKEYPAHPFADIFPLHDGPPLWDLRKDLEQNGQQLPITLYKDKVLDGRRRQVSLLALGIKPKYATFKGTEEEALKLSLSLNLFHRHLGSAERAMIAAKVATMTKGWPISADALVSQADAAKLLNVSVDAVKRAKLVNNHASEELKSAVLDKTVSLSDAAKVAKIDPAEQNEAVEKVRAGKAKTVTQAVTKIEKKEKPEKPETSPVDQADFPIPERCQDAFATAKLIEALCRELDAAGKRVAELRDMAGGEMLNVPSITQALKNVRQTIYQSRATHVCPYCKGKETEECNCCKTRGWTIKAYYSQAPDK